MPYKYTLEQLDNIIMITLNPAKGSVPAESEAAGILQTVQAEGHKVQASIKDQVFGLANEQEVETLIRQYHLALLQLRDQASENLAAAATAPEYRRQPCEAAVTSVDDLLAFIECRFRRYLSLDDRVPAGYLYRSQKELRRRLELLKTFLFAGIHDDVLCGIVIGTIAGFCTPKEPRPTATFRELFYYKELLHEIELLKGATGTGLSDASLNELLVYMNFNSRAYANHIIQRIKDKISLMDGYHKQADYLLRSLKELNQAQQREGAALCGAHAGLKCTLANWLGQELSYLEKRSALLPSHEPPAAGPAQAPKLACTLSVDQLALILRSASDTGVLEGRSLNAVFKTVAPHLSTAGKETVSADSMRSKSYSAENRDKDIAIAALQKMITQIMEY